MRKLFSLFAILLVSSESYAWGYMTGTVEVMYVNTYGNYSEVHLNAGYCFKLADHNHYLKIAHGDSGEKKSNVQIVHSMVLAAHIAGKELKATYVDWGNDTTCRINGAEQPAKWLENLQIL